MKNLFPVSIVLLSLAGMPVMAQNAEEKFVIESPCNIEGGGSVSVEGTVNDIPDGQSEVSLLVADKRFSCNITPNSKGNGDFKFENIAEIPENSVIKYTLEHIAGNDTVRYSSGVTSFRKKVFVEEGTGLWCGACVAGIVAMEEIKENYPDNTTAVALHYGSASNQDPMAADDIMEYIDELFVSFPTIIMDRNPDFKDHPNLWKMLYLKAKKVEPVAGIILDAVIAEDSSRVSLTSRLIFGNDYDDADFRMAYYVIENNVHSEDDSYAQKNYYADNAMGKMGGFENLPNPVPASEMYYQEVGRSSIGGLDGIKGSILAEIKAGEEVRYTHSIALPENIMNKNEVEIIALLIDGKTGFVVNSEIMAVKEMAVGGISDVADDSDIKVWEDRGRLVVSSDKMVEHVYIYSIDGTLAVAQNGGANEVAIPVADMNGAYIVKIVQEGKAYVRKVVL